MAKNLFQSYQEFVNRNMASKELVVPAWINGIQDELKSSLSVTSPVNNEVCWRAADSTVKDAIRAVDAAQLAFPSWSKTKPATRQKILFRAADLIEERIPMYGSFMETEVGCDARTIQWVLGTSVQFLRAIASQIPSIVGSVPVSDENGTSAMVWKEPYGVIFGISPWNAPYALGMRAIATAIATGNTTVIKGSEFSPRCYWALGKAFHDAGLPDGVLNIIFCNISTAPDMIEAIVKHPAVRKINFTGSTKVGRVIASLAGEQLKPCLMELGGKNCAIILSDADLEKTVGACIAGSFLNSGQVCMSTDRLIILAPIEEAFLGALQEGLGAMMATSPPPPRLFSAASKSRLQKAVTSAIYQGATKLIGGDDHISGAPVSGAPIDFRPMVLGGVTEAMDIWKEENFGPVVSYMIAKDEEEAIKMANNTEFGLSASVFTKDLRKAFAIAKRLESGAVHINSMTVRDEPSLPHGGVKNSGWGRFNTAVGMEEFLVTKTVTWDD